MGSIYNLYEMLIVAHGTDAWSYSEYFGIQRLLACILCEGGL